MFGGGAFSSTTSQPATNAFGSFGQNTNPAQTGTGAGLFGNNAFGQPQQQQQPSAFGAFSQPQQQQQANTGGLFGTGAFGQKPASTFGGTGTFGTGGAFGQQQPQQQQQPSGGLFGQNQQPQTATNAFGGTGAFGLFHLARPVITTNSL
jgi:nuclear pore complex protein Nup98-Nup96